MTEIETIKQLQSIIENADDMMESSDSDVWAKDKEACNNAIKVLKEREQMKYHVKPTYKVAKIHEELNPDFYSIRIPRVEYRELLKSKACIECAQALLDSHEYISTRELLAVLGLNEREDNNGEASE